MLAMAKMDGVDILDHGQHPIPPDRWRIQVVIRDARAAAALRERGIQIKLSEPRR